MQKQLARIMRNIRPFWWWRASTLALEVFSAWLAWCWTVLLFIMLGNDDDAHLHAFFGEMETMFPLEVWLTLFAGAGTIQTVAMCGNVFGLRYPALMVSLLLWSFVASLAVFTNGVDITNVPYALLTVLNAWAMLRGPSDKSEVDSNERGAGAPHQLGDANGAYDPDRTH